MSMVSLTLPLLRLFSSNAQTCKKLLKSSEPSLVGIHMKALMEYYQMSTHVPGAQGFNHFPAFCHHLIMTKLAPNSIRVKGRTEVLGRVWQ